ncbi:MAG: hypothetical protein IGQ88_08750 [Gloeomargaritaceae cyanobacterium C42_A2020_066]|nr:hypothetical protein [Gloeomargaritaceae cyanobacterium C42_A2020_066]
MSIVRPTVQDENSDTKQALAEKARVFADFHNADTQGRLRLNCIGTIEDLTIKNIALHNGQKLTFYSENLEVNGIVEYSQLEHVWVAVVNWDEIREIEEIPECEPGRWLHDIISSIPDTTEGSAHCASFENVDANRSPRT